jgi:hypothetical protein
VSFQSTVDIFAAPVAFEEPVACEGSAGDLPDASVDRLEAHLVAHAGV